MYDNTETLVFYRKAHQEGTVVFQELPLCESNHEHDSRPGRIIMVSKSQEGDEVDGRCVYPMANWHIDSFCGHRGDHIKTHADPRLEA